jgi:hypothetical protein
MRIVYHLGAHCTDEEQLLRCLLRNRGVLAEEGIAVPGPARYRTLLRDTLSTLKGEAATEETQAMVLDQIMDEAEASRLVLSWDNFLGYPAWALRGSLYPNAAERLRALTRIFPDIPAEFHLAIRNPASFIAALVERQKDRSYADVIEGTDPLLLRWSDMITRIRHLNPEVPLTVWCDEDRPLLWPQIIDVVSGRRGSAPLEGVEDSLAPLLSAAAFARLKGHLAERPGLGTESRMRVVQAYLTRFALPERLEEELDLPGWTADYADAISRAYEADLARIGQIPGVRFLSP